MLYAIEFNVCLTNLLQLTQLEHILKRPDSYIGSVEKITQPMWVWDSETKRMVNKEITYVPGFFKIVDEILVNAADNKVCCLPLCLNMPETHAVHRSTTPTWTPSK